MTLREQGPTSRTDASRRAAGFTLVEVMVAVVLFLIVLVPMLGMFISSVRAALITENQQAASALAQEQIEEMRSRKFDMLALNADLITAATGITGTAPNFSYTYQGTIYPVVATSGGPIVPLSASPPVRRRNAEFVVKRYVLRVNDAAGQMDYKKLVVAVSWSNPTPGQLVFETDAEKLGTTGPWPPVVNITQPYIGDAFTSWPEIGTFSASAIDSDGTPTKVAFQQKQNVQATFSSVGVDLTGTPDGSGRYAFSVTWNTTLSSESQYNLRAVVTDNDLQTGNQTIPVFLDPSPPAAPSGITLSNSSGATTSPVAWPVNVSWNPVSDFIDGNTNFNMVIGYIVYRDVRPVGDLSSPVTTTPIAILQGSSAARFVDGTPLSPGQEVRYRLKSLGRASAWRTSRLGEVPQVTSGWVPVTVPAILDAFSAFTAHSSAEDGTQVLATPLSWSAVRLLWPPQTDDGGHGADLYLVYRSLDDASYTLIATVPDPGAASTELVYDDQHLVRNTTYYYKILPVVMTEMNSASSVYGVANQVTTEVY